SRHRAGFIEAKLAGVDDEQALRVPEGRCAVGGRQAPPALERGGNCPCWSRGGSRRGWRGHIPRRPSGGAWSHLIYGSWQVSRGIRIGGDRIAFAAGGNGQDERNSDQGYAEPHTAPTRLNALRIRAARLLNSCKRQGRARIA